MPCLMLLSVTSCGGGQSLDTFCLTEKPIRRTSAEIDREPIEQVKADVVHNRDGANRCGWKP